MIRAVISLIVIFLSLHTFSQKADCRVRFISEPDVSIFFNGEFNCKVGCNEDNVVVMSGVVAGTHILKFIKSNCVAQTDTITLTASEEKVYSVKPFIPKINYLISGEEVTQDFTPNTGRFILRSWPLKIKVSIPDLGIDEMKPFEVITYPNIPVGAYDALFSYGSTELKYRLTIKEDSTTIIMANMKDRRVIDLNATYRKNHNKFWLCQNGKEVLITKDIERVRVRKDQFSLRYCRPKNDNYCFMSVFPDLKDLNEIKIGDKISDVKCFSSGAMYQPSKDGYDYLFVRNIDKGGFHCLVYGDSCNSTVERIGNYGNFIKLEFVVEKYVYNSKISKMRESLLDYLYFAILNDKNQNGVIDKGELIKLIINIV